MIEIMSVAADVIIVGAFTVSVVAKYRELHRAAKEAQEAPKH